MATHLADDRLARVEVARSGGGAIALHVTDASGAGLASRLTVAVTQEPFPAPSLDSLARLDSLPDAPRVATAVGLESLVQWDLPEPRLSDPAWFPKRHDLWRSLPQGPPPGPAATSDRMSSPRPGQQEFDPTLTLDEIRMEILRVPGRTHRRDRPDPLPLWAGNLRTGRDGRASVPLGRLPAGRWFAVVRGTAEGGRVVNAVLHL